MDNVYLPNNLKTFQDVCTSAVIVIPYLAKVLECLRADDLGQMLNYDSETLLL